MVPIRSFRAGGSGFRIDWKLLTGRRLVQIVHEVEVPDDYQEFTEQDMTSSSTSAWSTEVGGFEISDIGQ